MLGMTIDPIISGSTIKSRFFPESWKNEHEKSASPCGAALDSVNYQGAKITKRPILLTPQKQSAEDPGRPPYFAGGAAGVTAGAAAGSISALTMVSGVAGGSPRATLSTNSIPLVT